MTDTVNHIEGRSPQESKKTTAVGNRKKKKKWRDVWPWCVMELPFSIKGENEDLMERLMRMSSESKILTHDGPADPTEIEEAVDEKDNEIDRQEAVEIARQYYEEDELAEDISYRLEDDDRLAELKEQIAEELLQEKTQELQKMSDEDLLMEAGLDDCKIAGSDEIETQDDGIEAATGKKVISLEQARDDVIEAFEESLTDEGDLTHVVMNYYEAELPSEASKLLDEYNRVVGRGKLVFINDKPHIEVQNKDDDD